VTAVMTAVPKPFAKNSRLEVIIVSSIRLQTVSGDSPRESARACPTP
jgi:hypothetical protein